MVELKAPITVGLVDAYTDGIVWATCSDSEGRDACICIDARKASKTSYRLFDLARRPESSTAKLIELGAPEEGIVVPALSRWCDDTRQVDVLSVQLLVDAVQDAICNLGSAD